MEKPKRIRINQCISRMLYGNAIERCFGLWKKRFRLLTQPITMKHPEEVWELLYACVALHNYIRITDESVDYDLEVQLDQEKNVIIENEEVYNEQYGGMDPVLNAEYAQANAKRDTIAFNMWQDYLHHIDTNY